MVETPKVLSAPPMGEVLLFIVGTWEERGNVYPGVSGDGDMVIYARPGFKSCFVQVLHVQEALLKVL